MEPSKDIGEPLGRFPELARATENSEIAGIRPVIGPLGEILAASVQDDISNRTALSNAPVNRSELTDAWGGDVRNCLRTKDGRLVNVTAYGAVLAVFGERVGENVQVRLCCRKETTAQENLDGAGAEVIVTEKIADSLEIIYVLDGDFGGIAATGSPREIERGGHKYIKARQLVIHDLSSDRATDIRSMILPQTQLRYVPVAADSESAKRYFGQSYGQYLQVENITTPERLAAIFHEVGHERLQSADPRPSEEVTELMQKTVGGATKMLPEEEIRQLGGLLPKIEKGASDQALALWDYLTQNGINLSLPINKIKQFLNQGLLAHQKALQEDLKQAIEIETYS
ncbi:MAG: hypothetical protein M1484_04925 [Patescibacteria group bacterium]|nr:hypothetical protein [Patescibacteria group bacterium]